MAAPTRIQDLTRIAGGREADIFAWEGGTVLRLPFVEGLEETTERETAALQTAAAGGLRVLAYHGSVTIDGRVGQVLERLDGPDLLAGASSGPWKLRGLSRDFGRLHATMHGIKAPKGMRSLLDTLRVATLETLREIQRPFFERAQPVLARLDDGDILMHGDFHPGNVMIHQGDAVVIDWPGASAGPPEADVARTLMLLNIAELPDDTGRFARITTALGRGLLRRWYFKAYQRQRPLDVKALEDWYTAQLFARLGDEVTPGETKRIKVMLNKRLG